MATSVHTYGTIASHYPYNKYVSLNVCGGGKVEKAVISIATNVMMEIGEVYVVERSHYSTLGVL